MWSDPLAWSMMTLRPPDLAGGYEFGRWHSRVRGAPEILGQFPVSCLAEEIAEPGDGRIRGLVVIAGNPVISTPDSARLDDALEGLELLVSVDNWLNETSRRAHVILPGQSALEQAHYDELFWGWSVRNAARYSPPVFASEDGQPAEWQILLRLAALLGGQANDEIDVDGFDDAFFFGVVATEMTRPGSRIADRDPADIVAATPGRGPERLLDFGVRVGPHGDAYGADPDGLTLDPAAGKLTGVPASIGTYLFSVRATDSDDPAISDVQHLSATITFVCGDINNDGDVNVADAVYIINYVFKGGPAPVEPCCL